MMVELKGIYKSFYNNPPVLNGVNLRVNKGEFVQILGPSGAGKSTLLNILGLLDRGYAGEYYLLGQCISELNDSEYSRLRGERLGFIFQAYNLLNHMSVTDNIMLPSTYVKKDKHYLKERLDNLLWQFGIEKYKDTPVKYLSGGEKQRIAIARALILNPDIILADEPTGNLDPANAGIVVDTLSKLKRKGKTIIMVTHNTYLSVAADRRLVLKNGGLDEG